jgi:cytochrome P450
MARAVPVIDDVSLDQMFADPYPIYRRLRQEAPVAYIAAAGINLVTRFDDIIAIERDEETFPALDPRSLQIRAMGHTLMRRDGEAHQRERRVLEPSFRPGTVKNHWGPLFQQIADDLIADLAPRGKADLFTEFASPMAARSLMAILGLPQVDWRDMVWWSQSLIDATGNYGDRPEVWARNDVAVEGINAAIDERIPVYRAAPDQSVISALVNSEIELPVETIRANVKVIIGGGLNEPRDSICTAAYGLLSNPEQLPRVLADESAWKNVFEETVRWVAPIGMYPRRVAKRTELSGITLEPDMPIGLSAASACHDEKYFQDADRFDVFREKKPHLAFGSGPHFCLGTWVARKMVGEIAVPALFRRLGNLRLDPDNAPRMGGWVFRGPLSVPVLWDA